MPHVLTIDVVLPGAIAFRSVRSISIRSGHVADFISIGVSDAHATASTMVRTADQAVTTSQEASNASNRMGAEVEQCTAVFQQFFQQCQQALVESVGVSTSTLQGTDWTGRAQVEALGIDQELSGDINAFLGRADAAVAEFRTVMERQAQEFISAVDTEYRSYLQRYNENQTSAGQGVAQHADRLAEVDASYGVTRG